MTGDFQTLLKTKNYVLEALYSPQLSFTPSYDRLIVLSGLSNSTEHLLELPEITDVYSLKEIQILNQSCDELNYSYIANERHITVIEPEDKSLTFDCLLDVYLIGLNDEIFS